MTTKTTLRGAVSVCCEYTVEVGAKADGPSCVLCGWPCRLVARAGRFTSLEETLAAEREDRRPVSVYYPPLAGWELTMWAQVADRLDRAAAERAAAERVAAAERETHDRWVARQSGSAYVPAAEAPIQQRQWSGRFVCSTCGAPSMVLAQRDAVPTCERCALRAIEARMARRSTGEV